jgi:hypothetical protein
MKKKRRTEFSREAAPLGTVRVRGNPPVRYIKVATAGPAQRRWMRYARWLWEQEHGPVPAGMRIAHLDGDTLNDDPANLAPATPGDVVFLWHQRNPKGSEKNFAALSKATAETNRLRGEVNRRLNWLPTRWYAWFPAAGQVWNRPHRKLKPLVEECGIRWQNQYQQFAACLGWDGRSRGEALALHFLRQSQRPLSIDELVDRINGLVGLWGWRPLTKSGIYQSLGPLLADGLAERPARGRYEINPMAESASTRRSVVIPLRGDVLAVRADHDGLAKVETLEGICRKCGCTEDRACDGGCYWVAQDLCSACAEAAE